jgi:peptide chain release factor 3
LTPQTGGNIFLLTGKAMNHEIQRRRTLAIISHPDAGKTTLTEKLLLYGGALELAGSVTAKKKQRETSSDWMELEKKRGISISSTVLQFEYAGHAFNLLDTPGHRDFSEDTYRVLSAVDNAIMVIDAGKGIESQTIKLFEICRKRGVPIFTFMNKLDRAAMPPLELIDQLEKVLGIGAYPVNWPIENGVTFKGVYDRIKKEAHLFQKIPGGAYRAPVSVQSVDSLGASENMDSKAYSEFKEEIELLDYAHTEFNRQDILDGRISPVFFGSASNNFGVELLLKGFLEYSAGPAERKTNTGTVVPLENKAFSGFIFKVQTNMNPMHRDRMVFARVCSGRFERDIKVYQSRTGREIRLSSAHSLFGRDRETLDEAWPGDILGFVTNTPFKIGDTISSDPKIVYERIPRFAPECFATISNITTSSYKSFRKGLEHLIAEDIVQTFQVYSHGQMRTVLGAVGPLQFEVLQYRMKDEYGVETKLDMESWTLMRWLKEPIPTETLLENTPYSGAVGLDHENKQVLFFDNPWSLKSYQEKKPFEMTDISFETVSSED